MPVPVPVPLVSVPLVPPGPVPPPHGHRGGEPNDWELHAPELPGQIGLAPGPAEVHHDSPAPVHQSPTWIEILEQENLRPHLEVQDARGLAVLQLPPVRLGRRPVPGAEGPDLPGEPPHLGQVGPVYLGVPGLEQGGTDASFTSPPPSPSRSRVLHGVSPENLGALVAKLPDSGLVQDAPQPRVPALPVDAREEDGGGEGPAPAPGLEGEGAPCQVDRR